MTGLHVPCCDELSELIEHSEAAGAVDTDRFTVLIKGRLGLGFQLYDDGCYMPMRYCPFCGKQRPAPGSEDET